MQTGANMDRRSGLRRQRPHGKYNKAGEDVDQLFKKRNGWADICKQKVFFIRQSHYYSRVEYWMYHIHTHREQYLPGKEISGIGCSALDPETLRSLEWMF